MRNHIDRELQQVLLLGLEFERGVSAYPEAVRRSMCTAYATHWRAVLEFFHNGRRGIFAAGKPPSVNDMILSDILPSGDIGIRVTPRDRKRHRAADRLAAHMSRQRSRYHAGRHDWGHRYDRYAMNRRIRALVKQLTNPERSLPLTVAAIATIDEYQRDVTM